MSLLRKTVTPLAALAFASVCFAGDPATPQDKAKAALSLAKAAREREKVRQGILLKAETPQSAFEVAQRAGKPLVLWVGLDGSAEKPEVFKKLAAVAVQFRVDEYAGNKTPRLVYASADGTVFSLAPDQLSDEAVRVIKLSWVPVTPGLFLTGGLGYLPLPPE